VGIFYPASRGIEIEDWLLNFADLPWANILIKPCRKKTEACILTLGINLFGFSSLHSEF
jgi:hypothetical protein